MSEISYRPLLFLFPSIITLLFFKKVRWYFENRAMQSSTHSCPLDSKDPVAESLNLKTCCASSDNSVESFIFTCAVGVMTLPLATLICGLYAGFILSQYSVTSLL